MRKRYTVRYEVEVIAGSAKHAAMIVRDIMLDPSERMIMNVHDMEYWDSDHGGPDDWFPIEDRGWYAGFSDGGVVPTECFEWDRKKSVT